MAPTLDVLVLFLQTTDLTLIGPLFSGIMRHFPEENEKFFQKICFALFEP